MSNDPAGKEPINLWIIIFFDIKNLILQVGGSLFLVVAQVMQLATVPEHVAQGGLHFSH